MVKFQVETEVDPRNMGTWFSDMDNHDQVCFLASAIEGMSRWPSQWDAIVEKLNESENHHVRDKLKAVFGGSYD